MRDGIPRVLPSLINESFLRACAIFQKGISILIAVFDYPTSCCLCVGPQFREKRQIVGPADVGLKCNDEEQRRVYTPVIGYVRDLAAVGHLALPELVQYFAGLLIRIRLNLRTLMSC